MRILYTLGMFVVAGTLMGTDVFAAQIYLDPESESHVRHDTFFVPVRIDTQGECVNAVDVALGYNPEMLSVRDIAIGDSILTLWTRKPTVERDVDGNELGHVTFSGGIPGGYCGHVEGDPGQTNTLARLVVTGVPGTYTVGQYATTSIVVEPTTSVYVHDGLGTEASLSYLGVELQLVEATSTPENVWLGEVQEDDIAPDYFEIRLVEGPSEGNEYHYIVFSTTDKQSGVDHYEVLETDPDRFGFLTWASRESRWVTVDSPYVLRDQKLHSKIMVKAVDKNGNERTVEYTPPMSPFVEYTQLRVLIPVLVVLLVAALGMAFVVKLVRARRRLEARENLTQSNDRPHED